MRTAPTPLQTDWSIDPRLDEDRAAGEAHIIACDWLRFRDTDLLAIEARRPDAPLLIARTVAA